MSQQDALNYRELNNGDQAGCGSCLHGQFGPCTLHNFKCTPTHTCDSHKAAHPLPLSSFKVVNLEPPHGFLVWRGKQTAIASPEALPVGQVMITSGEEAFGLATLSQPAQMTLAEFEREEQSDRHRIRPEERKMLWPKAQALYVYGIKEWNGFSEPQPVIDGHIINYEPTPAEAALIEKSKRLPKTIIIHPEAVTLTNDGFTALDEVRGKELSAPLQAIFGRFRFQESKGAKALPLYSLALVRRPTLRFEEQKQAQVIREITEAGGVEDEILSIYEPKDRGGNYFVVTGDWATNETIEALKKVLGEGVEIEAEGWPKDIEETHTLIWPDKLKKKAIQEAAEIMPIETETDAAKAEDTTEVEAGEKRSLQELELIRARFEAKFCGHYGDWRSDPHPINVTDDSEVIVIWQGTLYAVPFTQTEGGEITFSPQLGWVPVKTTYTPVESTAMKATTETGAADTKPAGAETPTGQAEATTHDTQAVTQAKAGRRLASSWVEKLRAAKDALAELVGWAEYGDREEEEPEEGAMMLDMLKGSSGVAVKMVNGEPWHCSWSSNAFEDRDGEIFSLKSLEQYVEENAENEVKGYFNLWHIKNTDFAEKRYQAIIGKFLFEAGPYLKDFKGQAALEFFEAYPNGHPELAPEGWGASVEYRYLPEERKEKTYKWTWITRTSTLARGAAANVWTKATQENLMTDEQKTAALALFGKEFTDNLIAQGEQQTKKLEEAGVASKEKTEAAPAPEAGQPAGSEAATPPTEGQPPATPTEEPAEPTGDSVLVADPNQAIQALAEKLLANFGQALAPVINELQQHVVTQGSQITELANEIKQLKGEQALKQQVELPRFIFSTIQASQAKETVVTEGDALKNMKPEEAKTPIREGSVANAFFPAAK